MNERRWNDIDDEERGRLLRLKQSKALTPDVFAGLNLRMSHSSLIRKLNEYRPTFEARQMSLQAARSFKMPPSPSKRYIDYEVLDTDDLIIISDIEIPDHSSLYLERALLLGMAHGIRTLVITGDRVRYSRYHYLWVKNSDGKYGLIGHPRSGSKHSVKVAQGIYDTTPAPDGSKPVWVYTAHTHHAQSGFSGDGLCQCFGLGTGRDYERTGYAAVTFNTFPQWSSSIGMVRRKYPYNVTHRDDWRFWLGEYYPDEPTDKTSA